MIGEIFKGSLLTVFKITKDCSSWDLVSKHLPLPCPAQCVREVTGHIQNDNCNIS